MDFMQVISQVGFPIAVAAFSLIRLETTIQENTKAISSMSQALLLIQQEVRENKNE